MGDKFHSDTQEKIETIEYQPGLQASGDLEAGTKTITATSKPGTADYSKALTLSKPSDPRLVIRKIVARLQVTRDSGTSANLYCTVSVDSADGSTDLLFDSVDVQAGNLQVTDLTSGSLFDLLTDGASHTFYFFFWVDAGDSVISLVQLWEAVGQSSTSAYNSPALALLFEGEVSTAIRFYSVGTGTPALQVGLDYHADQNVSFGVVSGTGSVLRETLVWKNKAFFIAGTVSTDLNYLEQVRLNLRGVQ